VLVTGTCTFKINTYTFHTEDATRKYSTFLHTGDRLNGQVPLLPIDIPIIERSGNAFRPIAEDVFNLTILAAPTISIHKMI
jgi:hypothetical protein